MPGHHMAAGHGGVPDRAGTHKAGAGIRRGQMLRQNRHAQLLGGGLHQCCSAHAFPCGVQGKALFRAGVFQHFPRGTAGFPQQQRAADQLLQGQGSLLRQRVGRGQHCAQAVGSDRLGMQVGHRNAVFQQGKVELIFTQRFGQNTAVGHLGLQLNAGVERRKAAGQHRKDGAAQRDRCPHPHHAEGIPIPHGGFHMVKGIQQVNGLGIQALGSLGGGKMAVKPLKQPHAIVLFQFLDGAGHGGLGHVQVLGRMGYVAGAVYLRKNAHMAQGHRFVPP